jgi:hypothetical protein
MRTLLVIAAMLGVAVVSYGVGKSYPEFAKKWDACIALGGEHYRNGQCWRWEQKFIPMND